MQMQMQTRSLTVLTMFCILTCAIVLAVTYRRRYSFKKIHLSLKIISLKTVLADNMILSK